MGGVMALRRLGALFVGCVVALAVPASVSAESLLWTLTASPLTATTGTPTTFALTATNTDPAAGVLSDSRIGCINLDVPANFVIANAEVTGSNAGGGWHIDSITGNRIKIHSDSGGDRLRFLGRVDFTVTATATSTGSLTWAARAYSDQQCGGTGALLGVPPIVVVTDPTVTPTPRPTPVPTPTPTPILPMPLPSLPVPSVGLPPIGATATPSPSPTLRSGAPTPRATATATPDVPRPAESAATGGAVVPGTPPSGGQGPAAPAAPTSEQAGADAPRVDFDPAELDIDFESAGLLDGTTVWLVPTATFAIPALLLLLFVALQAVGALAWVPAVRRLSGRDDEVA
jgi:hypothetical protein